MGTPEAEVPLGGWPLFPGKALRPGVTGWDPGHAEGHPLPPSVASQHTGQVEAGERESQGLGRRR